MPGPITVSLGEVVTPTISDKLQMRRYYSRDGRPTAS